MVQKIWFLMDRVLPVCDAKHLVVGSQRFVGICCLHPQNKFSIVLTKPFTLVMFLRWSPLASCSVKLLLIYLSTVHLFRRCKKSAII
jgi:hypothetical protein